jgi:hypothetical protein
MLVVGIPAFIHAAFGSHIQARYKTMPPAAAKLIGLIIIMGLAIIVTGMHCSSSRGIQIHKGPQGEKRAAFGLTRARPAQQARALISAA